MSAIPIKPPSPINAATTRKLRPAPVSADGGGLAAATGEATTVGDAAVPSVGVAGVVGAAVRVAVAVGAALAVGAGVTEAGAVGAVVTTGLPVGAGEDADASVALAREPSAPGADAQT